MTNKAGQVCSHEVQGDAAGAPGSRSRREFIARAGGLATAGAAAMTLGPETLGQVFEIAPQEPTGDSDAGLFVTTSRRNRAAQIRHAAESFNRQAEWPEQPSNGDETLYSSRIGNYSKGLPHDARGEVDPQAYRSFLDALELEQPAAFEAIPLGSPPGNRVKLTNPQSGLAFDLEGADSHQLAMPPAPALASAETAGEMVELYWMCLLRDVNFLEYDGNAKASAAAAELSDLVDFRGVRDSFGNVTTGTLFRDPLPDVTRGPYVSQFLWMHTPFGAERVSRQMRTLMPEDDHMTSYADWLAIQNGIPPATQATFDPIARYIRCGRDLSQWVHIDVLFQAYFNAMLILLQPPDSGDPLTGGGIGAPLNPGNPYHSSQTQIGFGTFGGPHIATLVCEVATRALKAVWYQKWFVHRRLRPEVYAGRIEIHVTGNASYPLHADVLGSEARQAIVDGFGSSLLPMCFPEGSPTHPSYGAGHATVAGACVTILKALFDGSYVIPNPVVATPDGLSLEPWTGEDLTVAGELNKLASNVATGRNMAGVHWRSDAIESLRLGEALAISILRDQRGCYNEVFEGFTFTKFDGTTITV